MPLLFVLVLCLTFVLPSSCWQGETGANVLVGIQVPNEERKEFQNQAQTLGYEYAYEINNEAYRLLMQWLPNQEL